MSIQNFERVGGVLKQALSMLASESGEVQMSWGCVTGLEDLGGKLVVSVLLWGGTNVVSESV